MEKGTQYVRRHDVAAMDQAIQERHSHLLIAKDLRPLSKGQVGGNGDAGSFIAVTTSLLIMRPFLAHVGLTQRTTSSAERGKEVRGDSTRT